jgi:hypothetical protein
MLCIMHESEPAGSLLIKGKPVSEAQLAALTGIASKLVGSLIVELDENGVLSRDGDGTLFSRRMRRDSEKAARDKANGRRGGNPGLKGGVNPRVKPTDNGRDKAQRPEARDQNPSGPSDDQASPRLDGRGDHNPSRPFAWSDDAPFGRLPS